MTLSVQRIGSTLRRAGIAMAVLLAAAPLAACSDEGKLVLHSATGDYNFNVEVVDTPESRAQGLMYRQELADDTGMLFDFKGEQPVSFWMRNTFIPLDMIFVDAKGVVKNIHVNARPHDPTGIPSDGPVQFVLEIPGGRSVEIGLKPGDTMEHDRVGAPAAN
ncbi:hypothetical protein GCM10007913_18480 [Devosia yakushimensis]|uniref:DUF192 domain-containing protein n=1 Tax=Devosia yakushimensis TaxID=470028 RepID=A0ABQ5UDF0_9HYPH|nr:DUF192 domain-containing protein [Devosia yakushimensis]GLQ09916.1 hypothetical protein GCM10007913_18480 [Devosia yakushimensis]